MYEEFLAKQVRPIPIYSPEFPKPYIQWGRLNTNIHRNLPKPQKFPIHGAAQDPAFYSEKNYLVEQLLFESRFPFGQLSGFRTSSGILPVPDEAVNGYRWDEEANDWIIAAMV